MKPQISERRKKRGNTNEISFGALEGSRSSLRSPQQVSMYLSLARTGSWVHPCGPTERGRWGSQLSPSGPNWMLLFSGNGKKQKQKQKTLIPLWSFPLQQSQAHLDSRERNTDPTFQWADCQRHLVRRVCAMEDVNCGHIWIITATASLRKCDVWTESWKLSRC